MTISIQSAMSDKKSLEALGMKLVSEFQLAEQWRKENKETEWIESLRQSKGIYDPEVAAKIPKNKSKVYPKYTRSKEVPLIAKLNNMLFPSNDRNWNIQPTPSPLLSPAQIAVLAEDLMRNTVPGQLPIEPNMDSIQKVIKDFTKKTSEAMRTEMDDQLTETHFKDLVAKPAIKSGVRYGTGIIKGPIVMPYNYTDSIKGSNGEFSIGTKELYRPYFKYVPVWNWYPDMSVSEYEDTDYSYELHVMSKHDLLKLKTKKKFKADVITDYLKEHQEGDYVLKQWELDLMELGDKQSKYSTRKYQVLERWGFIDGYSLFTAGVDISPKEFDEEFYSNIWLLGPNVIKAVLSPTPKDPETERNMMMYHLFYYEKDESNIFGTGLPKSIRDTQISLCASYRMMLNHAARVAGPISEANVDLMVPGEDPLDISPDRVFVREGRGNEAQYPAYRVHNIESHIDEYLKIISRFEATGDAESTMPAFLWGEATAGSNETARGTSIKSSNTNLTIGDIVANFDATNESVLRSLFRWNMEHNPNPAIKGDMKVKACGVSSLLSKEVRTQALDMLAQTLRPEDEPWIKRGSFLRERMKVHDFDPDEIIYSDQEAEQNKQAMVDAEAAALQKEMVKAEITYTQSKAAHMNSKAVSEEKGTYLKAMDTLTKAQKELEQKVDTASTKPDPMIGNLQQTIKQLQAEITNINQLNQKDIKYLQDTIKKLEKENEKEDPDFKALIKSVDEIKKKEQPELKVVTELLKGLLTAMSQREQEKPEKEEKESEKEPMILNVTVQASDKPKTLNIKRDKTGKMTSAELTTEE